VAEARINSTFDAATGIARITLDRPETLNAIDVASAEAFLVAVRAAVAHEGLRCIVIRGSGRAFSAGGDVRAFGDPAGAPAIIDAILRPMNEALLMLRAAPAPVVTVVQGFAAGGGFALALAGDVVLAAEGARFAVAYTKLGGTPDCGLTSSLARRVGKAKTLELLIGDAVLDAAQASAMGVVSEVLPDSTFDAAVEERIARIARGPTRAYVACRDLLDGDRSYADQLEAERAAFVAAATTRDFAEGVAAFAGKREARFEGR
jgi:2-(1,2-epoxy-1,2-dihydrophenyl)acetyl-CoA isomerase